MKPQKLWFIGKFIVEYEPGKSAFEIQGIFSTKEKAKESCRCREYFLCPLELDVLLPDESFSSDEVEYPLA